MKKILSILGAITLIGTSSNSLVACNKSNEYTAEELKELKEKNKINTKDKTIRDNLEWMASQEKPFNKIDNKWYYVVCRGDKNDIWEIVKFNNNFKDNKFKVISKLKTGELTILYNTDYGRHLQVGYDVWKKRIPYTNNDYFKSVYRWNLDKKEPDLVINKDGNIKVKGE